MYTYRYLHLILDNVVGFVLHRTSFGSTHPTGKNLAVENPYSSNGSDGLPWRYRSHLRTETGGKIIDVGAQGALYVYFALVLFDQKQI